MTIIIKQNQVKNRVSKQNFLTNRKKADRHHLYTTLHSKDASYAHSDAVGQSANQNRLETKRKPLSERMEFNNRDVNYGFNPMLKG